MSIISPVQTNPDGSVRQTGSLQSLGRDDFLKLLVTKLQYQDPMKPLEDSAFIAQLAQFSTLEQMYKISEGIAASNEWDFLQMQSINNTMAAGLIGKDVKASYDGVYLDDDTNPTISFTTTEFAKEMTFTIKDSDGDVVRTIRNEDIKSGTGSIEWDGKDDFGNRLPEGAYTVEVSAVTGSGSVINPKLSLIGKVESITYRGGAAFLKVNGVELPLSDIVAIGAPGAFTDD